MKRTAFLAALGAVAMAVTACAGTSSAREDLIIAHGSDRRPNQTASDWVTYADHVVAVTPTAATELDPGRAARERGEGLILRRLELRVDNVLWSRPGVAQPAPRSFPWLAHGWQFTEGDLAHRSKMAGEGAPRMELGHSYIMAIAWEPERCSPGDHVPAQWRGLGADSTLPYDAGVIGNGETEGRVQSAAEALAAAVPDGLAPSLEDQMTGRDANALTTALTTAQPAVKQEFGPAATSLTACS
ncbi:hypothetical protein HII36_18105 [Nonomuraea sp. NN258]|uniref:hypothetical protein n=1 Tax=Nonomuraea antri TaxID=2730852 RepID=UPI00156A02E6|nr:hypothetical protein [Nonomuraea antri]NRQ33750.1 hypothetical protein [Nonomuraea antri]